MRSLYKHWNLSFPYLNDKALYLNHRNHLSK